VGDQRGRGIRAGTDEQVHVVGHDLERFDRPAPLGGLLTEERLQPGCDLTDQDALAVLRASDDVPADAVHRARRSAVLAERAHAGSIHQPCV
jgi:hypothetical protein